MTKFYQFNQNNSGGSFVEDENLCVDVYIEANNAEEANYLAENIGIYFNGCRDGSDCDCCGDRWYRVDESDGVDEEEALSIGKDYQWTERAKIIHYLNGNKTTL